MPTNTTKERYNDTFQNHNRSEHFKYSAKLYVEPCLTRGRMNNYNFNIQDLTIPRYRAHNEKHGLLVYKL